MAVGCRPQNSLKEYIPNMFQQFVLQYKDAAPNMYMFLSYVVSFPTSEEVVESWGSAIDHLNKNKYNTREGMGLDDTGRIDKLAFVRLNGPPPGSIKNRKMLKTGLNLMDKGDYAPHVLHMGKKLKTTSVAVERILNASSNVLPCFLD